MSSIINQNQEAWQDAKGEHHPVENPVDLVVLFVWVAGSDLPPHAPAGPQHPWLSSGDNDSFSLKDRGNDATQEFAPAMAPGV